MPWTGNEKLGVKSVHGEDYDGHYRNLDVKDAIFLDVGADWGSTAVWAIEKGAKKIIAIEGGKKLWYDQMLKTISTHPNFFQDKVIPVWLTIKSAKDYEELIQKYSPDIVKADVEGAEKFMKGISLKILRIPRLYVIEFHRDGEEEDVSEHITEGGFKVIEDYRWLGQVTIRFFRRLDDWVPPKLISNILPYCEECEEYECGLVEKYKTCELYKKALDEKAKIK